MSGMITDQTFAEMTKKYFMAILALRLQRIFSRNPNVNMIKVA